MCGIVGYVGDDEALPIVLEGLRRLEYRGYDSAGVAVLQGGDSMAVAKRAGKVLELEKALDEDGHPEGTVGMGHTRWATHGVPNDQNAHPHLDCRDRVAVIHNGIIENFHELRQRLQDDGHVLRSDTDTEVVAHLIEERLKDGSLGLADAVRASLKELTGAYALVVLSADEPGVIVGAKPPSPRC
jgi:glutamine---fructose-6-phosphate transaminase (isomerizing)